MSGIKGARMTDKEQIERLMKQIEKSMKRLDEIASVVDGDISDCDLDDAMDMLYAIKDILRRR